MPLLGQMQAVVGLLLPVAVIVIGIRRSRSRRQGRRPATIGNVFEVMDEVFSPARHSAAIELRTRPGTDDTRGEM